MVQLLLYTMEVLLWGLFGFSTSFGLPTSRIPNLEGPHSLLYLMHIIRHSGIAFECLTLTNVYPPPPNAGIIDMPFVVTITP